LGSGQVYKDASGNVGIGVTPSFALDVLRSANTVARVTTTATGSYGALRIENTNTNNEASIGFRDSSDSDATSWVIGKSVNATDVFGWYYGGAKMTLDTSGNLGIGTSSPIGILDARGDVYLGNTSTGTTTFVRGAANWNFAGLNVLRNASNTSTPRSIGMPLDGDNLASTTIGAYNAIWGAYDSSPTTGSTSSALNGVMVYGAYAGHRWFANGSEQMRITASGNVGIGTTSPNARLESAIVSSPGGPGFYGGANNLRLLAAAGSGYGEPAVKFQEFGTDVGAVIAGKNTQNGAMDIVFANRDTSSTTSTLTEKMRIIADGTLLVGINTGGASGARGQFYAPSTTNCLSARVSNSTYAPFAGYNAADSVVFYVTGGGSIYAVNTAITAISDVRHKENIRDLDTGLSQILQLRPRRFDWREGRGDGKKDVVGFIAQEVEAVLPDVVGEWKEDLSKEESWKALATGNMIPTLVKAIQELTARLEVLENK
jgi:hypothetical protein